jgi:hypothetical protein
MICTGVRVRGAAHAHLKAQCWRAFLQLRTENGVLAFFTPSVSEGSSNLVEPRPVEEWVRENAVRSRAVPDISIVEDAHREVLLMSLP